VAALLMAGVPSQVQADGLTVPDLGARALPLGEGRSFGESVPIPPEHKVLSPVQSVSV
jgi:hypothetical protein